MSLRERAHMRTWVGGAAALLIGICTLGALWQARGRHQVKWQAGAMPQAGAAPRAADQRSMASRARLAVAAGDLGSAFALYETLDGSSWSVEDGLALGKAFLGRDRIVLGWGALEAARRVDPKHVETLQALDTIQRRLATAMGQERGGLHDAARQVELLRSIPGGAPLGVFVLGLARFGGDSSQVDGFLDRLGLRDRSVLRAVDSTAAAIRLLARLLMEAGRAPEAYALLEPMIAAGKMPTEHEGPWLLSRAALQLDRNKVADEMLALAGDFGKRSAQDSPEPGPFVGSKLCAECHGKIYHQQQDESRHALTLRRGGALRDVPLPASPVPDPVAKGVTHAFDRKGDDQIEVESRTGSQQAVQAIVEYAVGSGRHGITMVARDGQGIHRELRVSYFAQDQSWGETKGIDSPPRDLGDHIGIALSSSTLNQCLACHTTWLEAADQSRPGRGGPEREDRGIGCERCHGPGLNHVKAARSGYPEMAIAVGANTPSPIRLKSCAQCHAADGSVQPTDPEFTRAQGTTFLFSRCYIASKDRFGCTTCHDPHRSVETATAHYESKCLDCHGAKAAEKEVQSNAKPDSHPARAVPRACPVNASGDCISCHMPKVEDPSRRSRFTDHHIRIHQATQRAAAATAPKLIVGPT